MPRRTTWRSVRAAEPPPAPAASAAGAAEEGRGEPALGSHGPSDAESATEGKGRGERSQRLRSAHFGASCNLVCNCWTRLAHASGVQGTFCSASGTHQGTAGRHRTVDRQAPRGAGPSRGGPVAPGGWQSAPPSLHDGRKAGEGGSRAPATSTRWSCSLTETQTGGPPPMPWGGSRLAYQCHVGDAIPGHDSVRTLRPHTPHLYT